MKRRDLIVIFLLAVIVHAVVARVELVPGYMDAEYYHAGGLRLAQGYGYSEPFLWNYLDDPAGVPHPSHTYWMPLPSLVAALGLWATGSTGFFAARLGFIALTGILAALAAWMAWRLNRSRLAGWMTGLFTIFSGFYVLYLSDSESFSLYMLLGSLFLLTASGLLDRRADAPILPVIALGALAGLMHLSRADGLLWLMAAVAVLLWIRLRARTLFTWKTAVLLAGVLAGYALIMLPWYARNVQLYGGLFAPGGSATLWLTDYNQTFSYPAGQIGLHNWLAAGWQTHVLARLAALGMNLKNALAVQGLIFLTPLKILGAWRLRDKAIVRLGIGMWLATLAFMTLVFPYSGARGGFIHSGAALQPLLFALVPAGLLSLTEWGERVRGWQPQQAATVLGMGLVVIAIFYSGVVFYQRGIGDTPGALAWREDYIQYQQLGRALNQFGAGADDLVMVNNPPGFFVATGRGSIVIPAEGLDAVQQVARRFGARYLLLDEDHAPELDALYRQPADAPGLTYLETVSDTHIFRLEAAQ